MDEKNQALDALKKLSSCRFLKLVERGNQAIFISFYVVKQEKRELLIPDQGGWLTYLDYPDILGLKCTKLKTDNALIDPATLEKVLSKKKRCALIVSSYGGYFVKEPLKEIAAICKKYDCLLIEDASSGIGSAGLCDGKLADIVIGSFGRWKPLPFGSGGFFATNDKTRYDCAKVLFSLAKFEPDYKKFLKAINNINKNLVAIFKRNKTVKKDLKAFKIIHRDSDSLNVIVAFDNDEEKRKIVKYIDNNRLEQTICPRYIRVERPAISIELKRG